MQFKGLHPLGLQTPGMQVDGLHDACACALFSVIVASTAGAVYAAAFRKWRRARSSSFGSPTSFFLALPVYPESAPGFQATSVAMVAGRGIRTRFNLAKL
jgi:hypothetical protein